MIVVLLLSSTDRWDLLHMNSLVDRTIDLSYYYMDLVSKSCWSRIPGGNRPLRVIVVLLLSSLGHWICTIQNDYLIVLYMDLMSTTSDAIHVPDGNEGLVLRLPRKRLVLLIPL